MAHGSEIIGHEKPFEQLLGAIGSGRAGHAWLFHGPRGVGKKGMAARFAAALLCLDPGDSPPCGTCRSCKAMEAGEHPDFDLIAPPEGSRSISIDAVRELNRRASLAPSLCGLRAFVVDDAHAMTEEGANSLLKTLEEPPGPSMFALVTHRPDSLLPTIRSRTMSVRFGSLSLEACSTVLTGRFAMEKALADELSRLSLGSPGRALELFASSAFCHRDSIRDEILKAQKRSIFDGAARLVDIAREDAGDGPLEALRKGLREVFSVASAFLRDVEVARLSPEGCEPLLADGGGFTDRALAVGDGAWASPALEALQKAREALDMNVGPALVVQWWFSKTVRALDALRIIKGDPAD